MARVLVVDDEPGVLRLMQRRLELGGFEVAVFQDPELAAEAFALDAGAFDAVVSDIMMPLMTGTELAAFILERTPDIPIVFVTGFAAPAVLEQELLSRHPVLSKPGDIGRLASTVAGLLRRKQRNRNPSCVSCG